MEIKKKHHQQVEEKKWEDPANPEKPEDNRDREQLARQIKEARRRRDNLTDNDKETKI